MKQQETVRQPRRSNQRSGCYTCREALHHQTCASAKTQSDINRRRLVFMVFRLRYLNERDRAKIDNGLCNHDNECESRTTNRMVQQQRRMCASKTLFRTASLLNRKRYRDKMCTLKNVGVIEVCDSG